MSVGDGPLQFKLRSNDEDDSLGGTLFLQTSIPLIVEKLSLAHVTYLSPSTSSIGREFCPPGNTNLQIGRGAVYLQKGQSKVVTQQPESSDSLEGTETTHKSLP
ncbi:hypothetical protein TNCV_4409241 [Trichonephila clavipes]|nr:hypothetical protein TNCV_4409241 [Trichonephila clavipes]